MAAHTANSTVNKAPRLAIMMSMLLPLDWYDLEQMRPHILPLQVINPITAGDNRRHVTSIQVTPAST